MELTKADAATVVNNNTAAVLLVVNALAIGKEVVVSHGDFIRSDPTLRLRELLVASGSVLRTVGTADRVTAADYDAAVTDRTGLLLSAHTGQDDGVELAELVLVGRRREIPVMEDLGRGTFIDLTRYGLPKEPVVAERVACGVDIVTFSGDKLVGGPQAGLIVGRAASLALLGKSALHRALQCSKCTIAALEATLRLYRESACVAQEVPALRAMTRSLSDIEDTANRALPALASALGTGFRLSLVDGLSHIGGGTPQASAIPTKMIIIQHDYMGGHRIAGRFRQASPPIVGRVEDDLFILDARTIFDPLEMVPNWTDELNLA
jgi:L-seryl-tRNA(Ser) seleniumtransferase